MALPPFRGKEGIRIANRRLTPPPRPEESRFRQYVAFSTRPSREPSRHFRRDVLGSRKADSRALTLGPAAVYLPLPGDPQARAPLADMVGPARAKAAVRRHFRLRRRNGVARIAGVNIPTNKRVTISLRYIYGIGPTKAQEICEKLSIPSERRVNQLTDDEVLRIRELVDREYRVEGDLRREVAMNIKRLMDLGCYRGLRHRRGLPVRGQRTHTNARTRKGKAVPIAGKKKVTK